MSTPNNNILREYAATANNPQYKGDWNVIDSKFPELKDYDKQVLREYAATANNPQYKGDWNVIDSKFPELFGNPSKQQINATNTPPISLPESNEEQYQEFQTKANEISRTGNPYNIFKGNQQPMTFVPGEGFKNVPKLGNLPSETQQEENRFKRNLSVNVDKTYQNRQFNTLEKKYAPVIDEHIKQTGKIIDKEVSVAEQKYNELKKNGQTTILDSGNIDWLLTNTKEILAKPSRYEDTNILQDAGNYFKGFGQNITNRDTWTFGMTEIARSLNTANIFKKIQAGKNLQPDEELLFSSFVTNMAANDLRADDIALAYQAGEGTAVSIPFMAEFAILGALSKPAKNMVIKSVTKTLGEKSATLVAKWLESGLMQHTLGTATMTAGMPTTYATMASDYLDKTIAGEDYNMSDAARSFGDSFVENLTERTVGKFLDKGLGFTAEKILGDKIKGFTRLGQAWNDAKILKDIPINSPLSEVGEEYAGAAINYGRSFNPLYDKYDNEKMRSEAGQLFTPEGTKVMLGSILPTTILPGAYGLFKKNLQAKNTKELENILQAKNTILENTVNPVIPTDIDIHDDNNHVASRINVVQAKQAMDKTLQDADFEFDYSIVEKTADEQKQIVDEVLSDETLSDEQKQSIVNYISSASVERKMQEMRREAYNAQLQEKEQKLTSRINENTNTLISGNLLGSKNAVYFVKGLAITTDENNKTVVDPKNSDEAIYYIDADGNTKVTIAKDIQQEITDGGTVEEIMNYWRESYAQLEEQRQNNINAAVEIGRASCRERVSSPV